MIYGIENPQKVFYPVLKFEKTHINENFLEKDNWISFGLHHREFYLPGFTDLPACLYACLPVCLLDCLPGFTVHLSVSHEANKT